jgi:hypothetical protein
MNIEKKEKEFFHVGKYPGDTHLFSDFSPFREDTVCSLTKEIYE